MPCERMASATRSMRSGRARVSPATGVGEERVDAGRRGRVQAAEGDQEQQRTRMELELEYGEFRAEQVIR